MALHAKTLIAIPKKSTLNSNSSYSFLDGGWKLGSYALGTKEKLWSLGSRSENIEF